MNEIKYWVTMTDRFMSNWGKAGNKINKLVIECASYDEAEIVSANACNRTEMKHVNICKHKPWYDCKAYYVSWHERSDCERWFKVEDNPRGFVKREDFNEQV